MLKKITYSLFFILLNLQPLLGMEDQEALNKELFSAIKKVNVEKVKTLIAIGASVHCLNKWDGGNFYGCTPLQIAVICQLNEIAEVLINNKAEVWVQYPDYYRRTPLLKAAANRDLKTIKLLLSSGAKATDKDSRGQDAFDNFINATVPRHNYAKIGKILTIAILKQLPISFKTQDESSSPLILSVTNKNNCPMIRFLPNILKIRLDIVNELLRRGAGIIVELQNDKGETAIDIAKKNGFSDIAKLLEKYIVKSLMQLCIQYINNNLEKVHPSNDDLPIELRSLINFPECIICCEELNNDNATLECGHNQFHYACLEQWKESGRNKNCPICRAKLN